MNGMEASTSSASASSHKRWGWACAEAETDAAEACLMAPLRDRDHVHVVVDRESSYHGVRQQHAPCCCLVRCLIRNLRTSRRMIRQRTRLLHGACGKCNRLSTISVGNDASCLYLTFGGLLAHAFVVHDILCPLDMTLFRRFSSKAKRSWRRRKAESRLRRCFHRTTAGRGGRRSQSHGVLAGHAVMLAYRAAQAVFKSSVGAGWWGIYAGDCRGGPVGKMAPWSRGHADICRGKRAGEGFVDVYVRCVVAR
jgi:hypothetical protein